jgi:hypothetical protein
MVRIEIDDEVWQVYKKSWALMGVRTEEKLIAFLNDDLWEKSLSVIEDSERQLIDDTPEAYVQREIGLEKERKKQSTNLRSSRTDRPPHTQQR